MFKNHYERDPQVTYMHGSKKKLTNLLSWLSSYLSPYIIILSILS